MSDRSIVADWLVECHKLHIQLADLREQLDEAERGYVDRVTELHVAKQRIAELESGLQEACALLDDVTEYTVGAVRSRLSRLFALAVPP